MSKSRLSMSCGHYDRTRALIDGTVLAEGIHLKVIPLDHQERHTRMMQRLEFDVCELSTAQFLTGKTRGLPVTAIPVFPYRAFRHSFIFVNAGAGIDEPRDLVGKRVGVRVFMNTASMWVRGILEDEYGVRHDQITWVTQTPEEVAEWRPPQGLRIQRRPPDKSLDGMLVAGELDAVIYPSVLPSIANGDPRVRRLFPNHKQVEMEYYARTKLFPIMHTVVVKDSVLKENPWVAASVMQAFERSKVLADEYCRGEAQSQLVWFLEAMAEQREALGPDPWAYGLSANRHAVEKMIEYAHRQGLIEYRPTVESLFAEGALSL